MITKRLAILLLFIGAAFSAVFLLPKAYEQPFGIILKLPEYLGDWKGKEQDVTQKERDVLGKGTEFARSVYTNPYLNVRGGYGLLVSIVLSGHDMSNSIHRPERCLEAQGWNLSDKASSFIEVPDLGAFPVTELYTSRSFQDEKGNLQKINSITCYWFVGSHEITSTHWSRWFVDNRDRFLKGVNQRWAFITVTGYIPSTAPEHAAEARKWTRENIQRFITRLGPKIHGPTVEYD